MYPGIWAVFENTASLCGAGFGLSLAVILLLAAKWKIGVRVALLGGGTAAAVAALVIAVISSSALAGGRLLSSQGSDGIRAGAPYVAEALFAQVALSLALAFALLMLAFWRDPERVPPETAGVILSAADGNVLYVTAVEKGSTPLVRKNGKDYLLSELTGIGSLAGAAYVIGVEMSFLNVHVNRCPIAGRVRLLNHIEGQFLSLRKEEAPFLNERMTTVIEGPTMSVATVQVASRLVRRIQSYLHLNQQVAAGQRLGMIRLGSLVAVVLPRQRDTTSQWEEIRITVKPGDRVIAGVSILARYDEDRSPGAVPGLGL
jgi:phosphatidylserine decarboxylase